MASGVDSYSETPVPIERPTEATLSNPARRDAVDYRTTTRRALQPRPIGMTVALR